MSRHRRRSGRRYSRRPTARFRNKPRRQKYYQVSRGGIRL